MLYSYFTEKLTGLQGVLIKNVEKNDDFITISFRNETHASQMSFLWLRD